MEIRTIELRRESVEADGELVETEKEQVEAGANAGDSYFAMDYFDELIVKKRKINESFSTIMNLGNNISDKEENVGQSYTLYFSDKMEEKYERSDDGYKEYKGSPFDTKENMWFLSIIQVHITPETLRRMQYKDESVWKKNIVLEAFLDDLYDILEQFCRQHVKDKFVCRIYQVLSAGDFAVAIKSQYPETSFLLSAEIRKRVMAEGKDPERWALYKTYTLLSMEKQPGNKFAMEGSQGNGTFVLRGCYSCTYWAKQREIAGYTKTHKWNLPDMLSGLNGRYDFTMELSENSFYHIYEELAAYKEKKKIADIKIEGYTENKEQYLIYLLRNGYLSYVNERYLLSKENEIADSDEDHISKSVLLETDAKQVLLLSVENNKRLKELEELYDRLSIEMQEILDSHQNAVQYFALLKKQILSCNTLNRQPDTRGFVVGISDILTTVLYSMQKYSQLYQRADRKNKIQLAELTVDYMREAVHALDNYMVHIRNNNLQSLQTPNYDIESNMGMEKLLIGYSEHIQKFFQYYQSYSKKKETKSYLPIVVPDLHKMDICVEALFPEGNGEIWKSEQKLMKKMAHDRYLLVIDSPTLSELGDMPVIMSMLFHEVAHQLRYEERGQRNEVVANIMVTEVMAQLAREIMNEVRSKVSVDAESYKVERILYEVLRRTAVQWVKEYNYWMKNWRTQPLNCFKRNFQGILFRFVYAWKGKTDIWSMTIQYIRNIETITGANACECQVLLRTLEDLIEKEDRSIEAIEKTGFAIAWRCAYKSTAPAGRNVNKEIGWMLNDDMTENWCRISEEQQMSFGHMWKFVDDMSLEGKKNIVRQVWRCFGAYAAWLESKLFDEREITSTLYDSAKDLKKEAYTQICEAWERENNLFVGLSSTNDSYGEKITAYRSWTLMGRYLGIDRTGNEKRFWEIACAQIEKLAVNSVENVVSNYREIASDLFMYNIMGLSPFGYLNLACIIISDGDRSRYYDVDRIITVIYVMTTGDIKDRGERMKKYGETCKEILKNLETYYMNLLDEQQESIFVQEIRAIEAGWDVEFEKRGRVSMYKLIQIINKKADEANKENKKKLCHIKAIVTLLHRILLDSQNCIGLLEENGVCLKDYMKGAHELKLIGEKMKQEEMYIGMLQELCSLSTKYIETEHYKTGEVKDPEINEKSIEFLLRLYYNRKIRNARVGRGDEKYEN